MENTIIALDGENWKSLLLSEGMLYVSAKKMKDVEQLKQAATGTGFLRSATAYPLSNLESLQLNETSPELKFKMLGENGKSESLKIKFDEPAKAIMVGHLIGQQSGLPVEERQEKSLKPLLNKSFYLLLALGFTGLVLFSDASEIASGEGGSRKSRSGRAILGLLYDTVGQTGLIIIGIIASALIAFNMYRRYKNPAKEWVYQKA